MPLAKYPTAEARATLTTKGQVTIPIQIRRLLRVDTGDKVTFVVEKDQIRLERGTSVVQRTAGALTSTSYHKTISQLREAAEETIAEETVGRS